VIIDSAATGLGVVYCGAGRNDRTLEISLTALLRATGAAVFAVARDHE
jgi:prolyl-tRNA editing enzyme YbaK/EbsC (Cys-tRNA(Pro) deacylase)